MFLGEKSVEKMAVVQECSGKKVCFKQALVVFKLQEWDFTAETNRCIITLMSTDMHPMLCETFYS